MSTTKRYPLKLAPGEVVCPRKSGPFPAVIGAMACLSMHGQNPARCGEAGCNEHIHTAEYGEHLRKHASEAMQQLFPSPGGE